MARNARRIHKCWSHANTPTCVLILLVVTLGVLCHLGKQVAWSQVGKADVKRARTRQYSKVLSDVLVLAGVRTKESACILIVCEIFRLLDAAVVAVLWSVLVTQTNRHDRAR
jgi:hypothetical protein